MKRRQLGPCASLFTKSGSSGGRGGGVKDGPSGRDLGDRKKKGEIVRVEEKLRTLNLSVLLGVAGLREKALRFLRQTGILLGEGVG